MSGNAPLRATKRLRKKCLGDAINPYGLRPPVYFLYHGPVVLYRPKADMQLFYFRS